MHRCSAYRCVSCNVMQIISIFSSLFTDYPHMPTPRRNHTIRLLLQYLDEEASPPPHFSASLPLGDEIQIFLLPPPVFVSLSASTGAHETPWKTNRCFCSFPFLCPVQSLSAAHHLTLCLIIALLIFSH